MGSNHAKLSKGKASTSRGASYPTEEIPWSDKKASTSRNTSFPTKETSRRHDEDLIASLENQVEIMSRRQIHVRETPTFYEFTLAAPEVRRGGPVTVYKSFAKDVGLIHIDVEGYQRLQSFPDDPRFFTDVERYYKTFELLPDDAQFDRRHVTVVDGKVKVTIPKGVGSAPAGVSESW